MESTSENDFECFASTGMNTLLTVFSEFRINLEATPR